MIRALGVALAVGGLVAGSAVGQEIGVMEAAYGREAAKLVCEPLRVCIVELEAGEAILRTYSGDPVRWTLDVQGADVGAPRGLVALKPTACGIATNVIVSTDRRVYDIQVEARPCQEAGDALALGPRRLRFSYPDQFARAWEASNGEAVRHRTSAAPAVNLNFDYKVSGKGAPKPDIVYDDGTKTFLFFRSTPREAPAVFKEGTEGLEVVPFRLEGECQPGASCGYVIEGLGEKFRLLLNQKEGKGVLVTAVRAETR